MGCTPSRVAPGDARTGTGKPSQLSVDFSALKQIDEHVRKTPPAATKSLQTLAEYLSSAATSDLEKIRAAYKWITANVAYDVDGYFGKAERKSTTPESVLADRISVCNGYASLMLSLCQLLGIECKKIVGYSKGVSREGYDPRKPMTIVVDTNHSWNVVRLHGEWRFIECTWGAGHVNDRNQFVPAENDFYFLTDPEVFIDAHFPYMNSNMKGSSRWQLLDKPITLDAFSSRVKRWKGCVEHQVELLSHRQACIDVTGEVTLKFKGTGKPLTSFSAMLANPDTGERISNGRHVATILDHRTNEATVTARPPASGGGAFWQLQVFGTTVENQKTSDNLVTYQLRTKGQPKDLRHFPNWTGFYGLHWDLAKCGLSRDSCSHQGFWLKASRSSSSGEHELLKIPISSRGVAAMASLTSADGAEAGNGFSFVETDDGHLRVSARLRQAGFYVLNLFCKEVGSNEKNYPCVAKFLVECTEPLERSKPFPKSYGRTLDERVTLECPRDGELPAQSEVRFRLRSPSLMEVMVNNEVHPIGKSGCFDFTVKTGSSGTEMSVFGTADASSESLGRLYMFKIV